NSQKATPEKIKLTSAGKIEFVSSDLITYCKAAGDYVELFFCDQRQRLYSGNLKDLQSQLPSTFLRVHRSYLVNTDYIKSLEKTASDAQKAPAGGGFLLLQGGFEVPVSRRIMPTVRSVL
ncbi:MAG: DNA-binding LytR/AlgR family response regulator, partial [Alteromonadaceae bacterium]